MGAPDLTNPGFWKSSKSAVLANPRDPDALEEASVIQQWMDHQPLLSGHILFRTSGSTGRGKWVALAKHAILASAEAVNDFLTVSSADRWLQTLPTFHVGGIGIAARAHVSDSQLITYQGGWCAASCYEKLEVDKITLSSFVPTQLADLVKLSLPAPPLLRAVIIGGGRLDDDLYQRATDLGWPVRETYGMTETSSQVATAQAHRRELDVLPCWQVKTDDHGRLQMTGVPLLTAYVGIDQEGVCFLEDPKQNGWLTSNDLGEVSAGCITIKGRTDRCVKILGELISLTDVEVSLTSVLREMNHGYVDFAVMALEEKRAGHRLILCIEGDDSLSNMLEVYHANCHPLHRIEKVVNFTELPRTGIGKISYAMLKKNLTEGEHLK